MRHVFCHHWHAWLYRIFLHYLTNGVTFGKAFVEHKTCILVLSTAFVRNLHILRNIQRDIVRKILRFSRKVPLFLSEFN
jgi:hypothetical protein